MGRPREANVSKWGIYKRNQRDGSRASRCAKCGKATQLVQDHRNGEKQDNRPSNRQTLCRSCHIRKHPEIAAKGGRAS